jgi:indole-3-glycerol phosphate synthase
LCNANHTCVPVAHEDNFTENINWKIFRIMAEFVEGFEFLANLKNEVTFFGSARSGTKLPIMQKDFVFDPYQIAEARAAGADAILLIADMLEKKELLELAASACEYGVDALVEVFTEGVVDAALETKATLIGVNTRNLRTLEMFPDNVERLGRLVPKDRVLVGESGIKNAADIAKLKKAGARAILVGESLLRQNDLTQATKTLAEACR